jgi:methylated-DNA-[protein]-cysteine S-methyltransferase
MRGGVGQVVSIQHCGSPCGRLVLGSVGGELCLCDWSSSPRADCNRRRLIRLLGAELRDEPSEVIRRAMAQLNEYFAGRRTAFDLPLRFVGTDFQRRVWRALLDIPYGETRSYKDLALRVGSPRGVRAVAQAIGANALAIVCPCHRVIGSDGSLTGFAGGMEAKRTLLTLERPGKKL